MCLILAVVSLVFAYGFFAQGQWLSGMGATFVGLFFSVLLWRNVKRYKKIKFDNKGKK